MAKKPKKDIRVAAISSIWGIATGMLALCVPLSAITRSGALLPIAIISGAAVSTLAVWRGGDEETQNNLLLSSSIKQLEQRVENLETICINQELDLQRQIKQLESRD